MDGKARVVGCVVVVSGYRQAGVVRYICMCVFPLGGEGGGGGGGGVDFNLKLCKFVPPGVWYWRCSHPGRDAPSFAGRDRASSNSGRVSARAGDLHLYADDAVIGRRVDAAGW